MSAKDFSNTKPREEETAAVEVEVEKNEMKETIEKEIMSCAMLYAL